MAWIQIHQQLKDHRKVLAAADELDIEPAHMLGLLISFWLWAIDNAPDGSLAGISDRMIARAAQWDKDPEEFVAALTSASLLDTTEDGVLEIHDWSEYTGKLIEQRENEKNRSRARRAAAKSNDRRTTAGQSADASKNDQKKTAGRVDQTRVDQSRPENKGDTPITPATEKQPSAQERRFAEFWTAYPKKVGKKAAQKAWEKAKPTLNCSRRSCRQWQQLKPRNNGCEKAAVSFPTRQHGSIRDAGTMNLSHLPDPEAINSDRVEIVENLTPWTCSRG